MKSAQILRGKIASNDVTLGLMATNHLWLELVEIVKNAGLDYLIIDEEHGHFDQELVVDVCSLGRLIDFPVLIRTHEAERSIVRRAADKGACGFVLPTVEDAATLDRVRDGLCLPPRGKRRPGGMGNRWVTDYNYETWRDQVEADFVVLPQIENLRGLANVEEIAAHELTTALAVGPYDLSASLGVCWQPDHPKLVEALETIRAAGLAVAKTTWMMGQAAQLIAQGFTLICIGESCWFLEAALREYVSNVRSGQGTAAAGRSTGDRPV